MNNILTSNKIKSNSHFTTRSKNSDRILIKISIYILVWIAIFIKGYGDLIIQGGGDGGVFQIKHLLLILAGLLSLVCSRKNIRELYLENLFIFLIVICVLVFISLIQIIINGNPSFITIKELVIFLYPMFFSVGIFSFLRISEVQFMMKTSFLIYIILYSSKYWALIINPMTYLNINLFESFSPLENSFFATGMDGFFIFFIMTSKSKVFKILSAIFNFMVFKRISVIFIPIFFLARLKFADSDFFKRKVWIFGVIFTFLTVLTMFIVMKPQFLSYLAATFPTLNIQYLFMGRNRMFELLLSKGFRSSGLGTTQNVLGKIFENDGLKLLMEVGVVGLISVIIGIWKITKNNILSVIIVSYISLTFVNATVLFGSPSPFLMFPVYLTLLVIQQRSNINHNY